MTTQAAISFNKPATGRRRTHEIRGHVDIARWGKLWRERVPSAQLAEIVFEMFYFAPGLIGRFTAKTVDNRLNPALFDGSNGTISLLRVGYFADGIRRTAELRNTARNINGKQLYAVLTVTSAADAEDAAEFLAEQVAWLEQDGVQHG